MQTAIPHMPLDSRIGGNARGLGRDGLAFYEHCERTGPIVRARAYATPFYVVTEPDLIEEILVKQAKAFHKPALLKGLRIVFGDGILVSDDELWRHRRRMLQPAFHARHNGKYGAQMAGGIARHLSTWPTDATFDVHAAAIAICIENLTRTLLGIEDDALTSDIEAMASLCHEIVQAGMSFRFPYWGLLAAFPGLAYLPFGLRVRRLTRSIVGRVTALRAAEGAARTDEDFFSCLTHRADLGGAPVGAKGIRDELITTLLAGHETAAAATSWALYLLAQHPGILAKLVRELDTVCGDRLPTAEDIPTLPFLDAVLTETYRLYPPTHRIARKVKEAVTIGGHALDVGTDVAIPIWAVHRSPRSYDAPLEFRPDRWTEAFRATLPRFAYLPFSAGPRVCIGRALVTLEDALIIGSIVKTFAIALPDGERIAPTEGLTLLPGNGSLRLVLRRR